MQETITIDALTKNSVSIKRQKTITAEGSTYEIGEPHRRAYANSAAGREQIAAELPEPYLSAVLAVWGDAPTVEDPAEGGVE
jgi:hypothetical protein|nr:MAG TPA: hypothetical protein [Caudoviricetes sp.]